ncbi:VOC family protein [Synechococcus sp. CS-1329]|uniref:VOC family protein n=1 Tax=Synechococcus sp. CS-1329 TaxID=2847975 RepID=UPI00223B7927|nr:VOC family protein [Synechococcus sp. CS-1329]MCT0217440.1 VOC family protein [Synechococcus sp. CS-1329]
MSTAQTDTTLVLAADQPQRLAGFYATLLGSEAQQGLASSHWRLAWPGGGRLEIYAPSSQRPQPRSPGRLALCLQRSSPAEERLPELQAWVAQALALGATAQEAPRLESFGAEAWIADPEGNRLLLLVC